MSTMIELSGLKTALSRNQGLLATKIAPGGGTRFVHFGESSFCT
jgi:hypothetical protein